VSGSVRFNDYGGAVDILRMGVRIGGEGGQSGLGDWGKGHIVRCCMTEFRVWESVSLGRSRTG
jgi:hypothetical protein